MALEPTPPHFATPVLAGCHPDPSVCRWKGGYVMVTSSFAYWPGLPVHQSTDLVTWEPTGHVLFNPDLLGRHGLDLSDLELSDGVWAPTVRSHEGTLYVVFSTARERRADKTFVCTATDPAGPWSAPKPLNVTGIDPSLYFEDGRCWLTACRDTQTPGATGPGELFMRELCLQTLDLVGEEHVLWHGAVHGAWAEAPRIFQRGGRYHLIAAEGGTERHHAVTAATADTLYGPWRTDPRSPLITHRHLSIDAPVQNVGHADLVDAADGSTWAFLLATRPVDGGHVLGREVFLTPVTWEPQGPVFAEGKGYLAPLRPVPTTQPSSTPADIRDPRSDTRFNAGAQASFDSDSSTHVSVNPALPLRDAPGRPATSRATDQARPLGTRGNRTLEVSLRGPVQHADIDGDHWVTPNPRALHSRGTPAVVGLHQDAHACSFSATLDLDDLSTGSRSGLVAYQHQDAFFALEAVVELNGERSIQAVLRTPQGHEQLGRWDLSARSGPRHPAADSTATPTAGARARLLLTAGPRSYSARTTIGGETRDLGRISHHALATEQVGGFLGVLLALSAFAPTGSPSVRFADVDYRPLPLPIGVEEPSS